MYLRHGQFPDKQEMKFLGILIFFQIDSASLTCCTL